MHSIKTYGDNLTEIRNTLKIANGEQKFVEGFEEGRIFNAYRFVYPLFNNDEHIGCMEISPSFVIVTKLMKELYDNQSIFIMKKSIVNEKVWKEQIEENYGECLISNLYYYDKEIYNYIEDKDKFREMLMKLESEKKLMI